MSLTNPNTPISEQDLKDFYEKIKPYLGTNAASSEDMSEIVNPLPSIPTRGHKYSTEEQVVGEWIDGKPIYQKVIQTTNFKITTDMTAGNKFIPFADVGLYNVDKVVCIMGMFENGNPLINAWSNSGSRADYYNRVVPDIGNTNFVLQGNRLALSEQPLHIIIQYTKTTD